MLSNLSSPAISAPGCKPSLNIPSYNTHVNRPARRATMLAREVRNPLTCINLSLDMLSTATTEKEQKVYIDIISRSSTRINHLIKELLRCQEIDAPAQTQY